ncbi:MAG: hypothetical protein WAK93_09720 [Solirubrobacteraceae bacterium]
MATAIEQAKQTAGDKKVGLFGATVMQQALPLGLVDEIRVHVTPVLLAGGTPLFAALDSAISLERTQVVATPAATHLGFRVVQQQAEHERRYAKTASHRTRRAGVPCPAGGSSWDALGRAGEDAFSDTTTLRTTGRYLAGMRVLSPRQTRDGRGGPVSQLANCATKATRFA